MTKINGNKELTNSEKVNEVAADLRRNSSEPSKQSSIYEAGKHYYQYLKDLKNDDDSSDYNTAFMMF